MVDGGSTLAAGKSWYKGVLQIVDYAVDGCWALSDGAEVSFKLEWRVVILRSVYWILHILGYLNM